MKKGHLGVRIWCSWLSKSEEDGGGRESARRDERWGGREGRRDQAHKGSSVGDQPSSPNSQYRQEAISDPFPLGEKMKPALASLRAGTG